MGKQRRVRKLLKQHGQLDCHSAFIDLTLADTDMWGCLSVSICAKLLDNLHINLSPIAYIKIEMRAEGYGK